jgi:hypothetical protein
MKRLARLAAIAALAGVATLLPAGMAVATSTAQASTSLAATEVHALSGGRYSCLDYWSCVYARSNYVRYGYRVSSITYIPPGATCPGGCGGPAWYFDWSSR